MPDPHARAARICNTLLLVVCSGLRLTPVEAEIARMTIFAALVVLRSALMRRASPQVPLGKAASWRGGSTAAPVSRGWRCAA
jgi:hypothetical protein